MPLLIETSTFFFPLNSTPSSQSATVETFSFLLAMVTESDLVWRLKVISFRDWEWFGLETISYLVWTLRVIWFWDWEWFGLETQSDLVSRLEVIWVGDSKWFGFETRRDLGWRLRVIWNFCCGVFSVCRRIRLETYLYIYNVMARDRSNDCHRTDNFNSLDCVHMLMNSVPIVFAVEMAWIVPWRVHRWFLRSKIDLW